MVGIKNVKKKPRSGPRSRSEEIEMRIDRLFEFIFNSHAVENVNGF